jgi:rubredoxin
VKKYICAVCGWVYDPAKGDPDAGVPPGVAFDKLPEKWVCPVCGASREEFSPVDE